MTALKIRIDCSHGYALNADSPIWTDVGGQHSAVRRDNRQGGFILPKRVAAFLLDATIFLLRGVKPVMNGVDPRRYRKPVVLGADWSALVPTPTVGDRRIAEGADPSR
jgi:hypothetical protein